MRFINFKSFLMERMTAFSNIAKALDTMSKKRFRVTRGNKGEIRLQPIKRGGIIDPMLVNNILDKIGHPVDRVVDPGHPDAKSSKYPTRWTISNIPVVIGSGGPKGLKHEEDVAGEVKALISGKGGSERARNLIEGIGLDLNNVANIIHVSGKAARRPLQPTPRDVGAAIADITILTTDGEKHYISLKDPKGDTFGNFGITGSFALDPATNEVKINPHPSDSLLRALGIDKEKIREGLQAYINKQGGETPVDNSPSYNKDALKGYLESAYGYGYWYAKAISKTDWDIKDLRRKENLDELIGDVRLTKISYPGKWKQATATVESSEGDKYLFEIRNAKGGVIPTEIKVKKSRKKS